VLAVDFNHGHALSWIDHGCCHTGFAHLGLLEGRNPTTDYDGRRPRPEATDADPSDECIGNAYALLHTQKLATTHSCKTTPVPLA